MRRRVLADRPLTVDEMPEPLREFDPAAWGWPGRAYADGLLVGGYRLAWQRWADARRDWCTANLSAADWLGRVIGSSPDEPWPGGIDR